MSLTLGGATRRTNAPDFSYINRNYEDVLARKMKKLAEQKELVDQCNSTLTNKTNGYNVETSKVMKNLGAAIAASSRPGFFDYYQSDPYIAKQQKDEVLQNQIKKVQRLQFEIDKIDQELVVAQRKKQEYNVNGSTPSVSNMSQWFAQYGQPKPEPAVGFLTQFKPGNHQYGGPNHKGTPHPKWKGFKSQAVVLKRGRMTK
jgi:hypothetical protein